MIHAGVLLGLASALFWSLANVTIQKASRRFGTFGSLFYAQVIGVVLAAALGLMRHGIPDLGSVRLWVWTGIAALAACVAYGGLFESLKHGRLALAAPIVSAWSALTAGAGLLFYGETPGMLGVAGIVLVLCGNALLARAADRGAGSTGQERRAVLAATAGALGFGIMVPAVREVGHDVGSSWAVALIWSTELLLLLPWLLHKGRLPAPQGFASLRVVFLPGVLEVLGFLALSEAVARAPLTEVAPASSLSTAFSVTWGLVLLRERLTPFAFAGAVAASLGVVLVNASSP